MLVKDVLITVSGILPGLVFLYKIEGYEGCYCADCVKAITGQEVYHVI